MIMVVQPWEVQMVLIDGWFVGSFSAAAYWTWGVKMSINKANSSVCDFIYSHIRYIHWREAMGSGGMIVLGVFWLEIRSTVSCWRRIIWYHKRMVFHLLVALLASLFGQVKFNLREEGIVSGCGTLITVCVCAKHLNCFHSMAWKRGSSNQGDAPPPPLEVMFEPIIHVSWILFSVWYVYTCTVFCYFASFVDTLNVARHSPCYEIWEDPLVQHNQSTHKWSYLIIEIFSIESVIGMEMPDICCLRLGDTSNVRTLRFRDEARRLRVKHCTYNTFGCNCKYTWMIIRN